MRFQLNPSYVTSPVNITSVIITFLLVNNAEALIWFTTHPIAAANRDDNVPLILINQLGSPFLRHRRSLLVTVA